MMVDKNTDESLNSFRAVEAQQPTRFSQKIARILTKGAKRELKSPWNHVITVLACIMATFHLIAAGLGTIPTKYVLVVHLGFILSMIFIIFPFGSKSNLKRPTLIDIILSSASAVVIGYIGVFSAAIYQQMGVATTSDLICGGIAICLLLEGCRRAIGLPLPIVAIAFILYALMGRSIPGIFQHYGFSVSEIINILYLTDEGIFGVALQTSATYIVLFVLFGAIMASINMTKFLTDFALGFAGWMIGGPAKVATVASGLMGTVSGSVSGNVATTGVMTIPLMKSIGYQPYYAGAVECVASAGGQLMPPVMGAAAFLMAQFLGIPYSKIVIAAAIPALLYYVSVWTAVDLRARKMSLGTIKKGDVPPLLITLKHYGHLAIPLVAIFYFLVIKRYSPIYSAFLAILLAVIISFFRSNTRITLPKLISAFEAGVRNTIPVAIACATAGFVIGVITLTGFGLVVSLNIIKLSFGSIMVTLMLGMLASIILGMELPTTACYIVTALTVAPAMIKMGIDPLAAHFFVFYFAVLSTLTPPVALSSFVAAGIAKSDPIKTAITGFRLVVAGFIIPYMVILKPALLVGDYGAMQIVYSFLISIMGIMMLAVINEGYFMGKLHGIQRVALVVGVIGLLFLGKIGDAIAIPIILIVLFMQVIKSKRNMAKS
jgi:TRAP transporter 4TM/12TM fusion protein